MSELKKLRDHYDSTDQSAALEAAVRQDQPTDGLLVSTSIRLSAKTLDRVRARAEAAGIPATTLMREWIEARVDRDSDSLVLAVADLERFIAASAHRAP